jgi:hypothetical protein
MSSVNLIAQRVRNRAITVPILAQPGPMRLDLPSVYSVESGYVVPDFDIVVIGGGHNGLVAANYLADAGYQGLCARATRRSGG